MSQPVLVVLAGPNGAGKSTYFARRLSQLGYPFVNADVIAKAMDPNDPMRVSAAAAQVAEIERQTLLLRGESFCMETVFSDPAGAKLDFFRQAQAKGFHVVLVFIGVDSAQLSQFRVMERVSQGGHDVPDDRLIARYPRSLANLRAASEFVDELRIIDNSSAQHPYRLVARAERGFLIERNDPLPDWAKPTVDALR